MARKQAISSGNATGSRWEPSVVTPAISTSNGSLTAAGIFTGTFTAPNTSNKTTGCRIFVGVKPANGGNIVVTLQEATVDTACTATILNADIKQGWNYVRFPTPYQWTATTAGRYRFKVANSVGTSGGVALIAAASTVTFKDTYDSVGTLGSTDDMDIDGFNNSGLTPIQVDITGTTLVWGSGTDKSVSSSVPRSVGEAASIGSGGTLKSDTTATCTFQHRGQIVAYEGGTFDKRAHATDHTIVSTEIVDCETANGNYAINNMDGGKILTKGAPCTRYAEYVSGVGTAANPLIVDRNCDWQVGEEIAIGGNTYLQVESRFIKTRNSATSFVLCTTPGGVEAAWTNSHTATETIALLSRNSVIKSQDITRGFYIYNNSNTVGDFDITDTQFYYPSLASGVGGINIKTIAGRRAAADGAVLYGGISSRIGFAYTAGSETETVTGLFCYLPTSTNTGSGAIALGGVGSGLYNHTLAECIIFGAASQSLVFNNSYNITVNNFRASGCNTTNNAAGHAIYLVNSGSIVFNNCRIDSTRGQGIKLAGTSMVVFNNLRSGFIGTNTVDVTTDTTTTNDVTFADSYFYSGTLISNYLNQLEGSEVRFQNMDGSTSKHRWYTNHGSAWSSGSGLTDTTTRTAGSLALAIKPEDNSAGFAWSFKIPANPTSQVGIFGYGNRNATFSSGVFKIELFLPGNTTNTPDATQTLSTTTGSWLPFNISAYYSGAVARYATVKVTVISATVGAIAFIDDLYDAGTGNKVAGLDLWDSGKPSAIMVQSDFSVIPSAVWGYSDANTQVGTMGKRQIDASKAKLLL